MVNFNRKKSAISELEKAGIDSKEFAKLDLEKQLNSIESNAFYWVISVTAIKVGAGLNSRIQKTMNILNFPSGKIYKTAEKECENSSEKSMILLHDPTGKYADKEPTKRTRIKVEEK